MAPVEQKEERLYLFVLLILIYAFFFFWFLAEVGMILSIILLTLAITICHNNHSLQINLLQLFLHFQDRN